MIHSLLRYITDKTLIVNYHYFQSPKTPFIGTCGLSHSHFEQQLLQLKNSGYNVILTFDDAAKTIFPAVRLALSHGITCFIFISSLPYLEHKLLNVTKYHCLQSYLGSDSFFSSLRSLVGEPPDYSESFVDRYGPLGNMYRYDNDYVRRFKFFFNLELETQKKESILDQLFKELIGSQEEVSSNIYLSMYELQSLLDIGALFGSHSHSHPILSLLDYEAQYREMSISKSFLEDSFDINIKTFSYPSGVPGAFDTNSFNALSTTNYDSAVSLGRKIIENSSKLNPFDIPRFDTNDISKLSL